MADVYCAEDLQLGRKVALKVLYRRFAEDGEFVERFRREASSAAGLQHQHVVARLRPRRVRRHLLHRDGVPRGALAEDDRPAGGAAGPRPRDRPDHPDPARRALRPPPRDHPPRPQAPQRDRRRRGPREGHRLRDRPRRRVGHDRRPARSWARRSTCRPSRPRATRSARRRTSTRSGSCSTSCSPGRVPFDGESAVTIALKQVNERPAPPSALQPGGARPSSRRSCCARWRRTRRGASPTPTRSSPRCRPRATARPTADPRAGRRRRRSIRPSEAYAYPEEPLAPREPREGGRWWLWLLAVLVAARSASPPCCCCPARRRSRSPPSSAPTRPTPRPSCARTASASTPTLKTADQPKGQVIGQDPTGGTKAKKGSTVTLTVSDGPQQVAVPQVVGLTVSSARGRLDKAGLQGLRARGELRHRREGQGDLGQPDRRARRSTRARRSRSSSQRQAAGRGPRRHRQELRRGAARPAGGRLQGHAHGQGVDRRRTRTPCSSQNPKGGTQVDAGLDGRAHGGQGAQPGRGARRDRRGRARGDRSAVRRRAS